MNNFIPEEHPEEFEKIKKFLQTHKLNARHTYMIIVRNNDEIELHQRIRRPCYGEMRNYGEKSKNRPQDYQPGDLENNFPEGTPIGVAICLQKQPGLRNKFLKHLFSSYNPWLGRNEEFCNNTRIFEEDEQVYGVLIGTGDLSPTGIVASCMLQRGIYSANETLCETLIKEGVREEVALSISLVSTQYHDSVQMYGNSVIHQYSSVDRFLDRNPLDLDGGILWSEGCDYNRPEIMFGFTEDRDKNPRHFMSYNTIDNFMNKFKLLER